MRDRAIVFLGADDTLDMRLYQSELRYHINKEIYLKPTFEVELFGRTYRGVTKMKRALGKTFRRYMIHGVELPVAESFDAGVKETLAHLKRDFHKSYTDLFFQLGFVNQIDRRPTAAVKDDEQVADLKQQRVYQQSDFRQWYSLKPSRREHMPNATIVLDLTQSADEMRDGFSNSCKRYINKGKKVGLTFHLATKKDREPYRQMRYETGFDKGFTVVPKEQFLKMMSYTDRHDKMQLFLAKKGTDIVSGSIVLLDHDEQTMLYLYGATDRSHGNIGGHYRLTYEMMQRGHSHELRGYDLFGIAPPGFEEGHHLKGVSRFKQSFGGEAVSYVGNYDLLFNKLVYKTYKLWKGKTT